MFFSHPPLLPCSAIQDKDSHGEQTDYHDEFMSPQRYVGLNYDKILPCVGLSDNDLQFC